MFHCVFDLCFVLLLHCRNRSIYNITGEKIQTPLISNASKYQATNLTIHLSVSATWFKNSESISKESLYLSSRESITEKAWDQEVLFSQVTCMNKDLQSLFTHSKHMRGEGGSILRKIVNANICYCKLIFLLNLSHIKDTIHV